MTTLRGLKAAWTTKAGDIVNSAFAITVTVVNASRQDIKFTVGGSARYFLRYWLVDSTSTPDVKTVAPPSGSDVVEWEHLTAADGTYTHIILNTTSPKTWYMVGVLGSQYAISNAITF
jgi:hypothetical protein